MKPSEVYRMAAMRVLREGDAGAIYELRDDLFTEVLSTKKSGKNYVPFDDAPPTELCLFLLLMSEIAKDSE